MATAWLNNPNRDNDAWRSLYELCVKYNIDPDLSTSVPRFRTENLECKRRLQQILRTDTLHRSRSRPIQKSQDANAGLEAKLSPTSHPPHHHTTAQNPHPESDIASTSKVKAGTLWGKSKEDLLKQLGELKTDLGQLRIQKINSSGAKLNRIHDIRKSIARVLTVINLKQRSQLRLFYKNKKYLPLDLRAKQTRAIRRRLSPAEAGKVLEKTKKHSTHFPQRKYAVKV
ncbi:hypothetical protein AB5N19_00311 [Seiridium cardinale]